MNMDAVRDRLSALRKRVTGSQPGTFVTLASEPLMGGDSSSPSRTGGVAPLPTRARSYATAAASPGAGGYSASRQWTHGGGAAAQSSPRSSGWSTAATAYAQQASANKAQQAAAGQAASRAAPTLSEQLKDVAAAANEAVGLALEVLSIPLEQRDVLLNEDFEQVAAQTRGVIAAAVNCAEPVDESALAAAVEALDVLGAVMESLAAPQQPATPTVASSAASAAAVQGGGGFDPNKPLIDL